MLWSERTRIDSHFLKCFCLLKKVDSTLFHRKASNLANSISVNQIRHSKLPIIQIKQYKTWIKMIIKNPFVNVTNGYRKFWQLMALNLYHILFLIRYRALSIHFNKLKVLERYRKLALVRLEINQYIHLFPLIMYILFSRLPFSALS